MVLTTTIVQSSCNLPLFPLHCGIWGNRLQEASFPAAWHNDGTGLAQLWYNDGTTLALRRVSRFLGGFGNKWPIHRPQMPLTYVSRPKKFPGLRTQLPIPGFGSQDLVTPVATSIKTLASEVVRGMS